MLLALLVAALIVPAGAQIADDRWENGVSEAAPFDPESCPPERVAALKRQWETIGAAPADEWAGDYTIGTVGDVHMKILRWAPGAGYAFLSVSNCFPLIDGVDYGRVELTPGRLRLVSEAPAAPPRTHGHGHGAHARRAQSQVYLSVKWGECHFLVAEEAISDFYDSVAGTGDYRPRQYWIPLDEAFFLKREDRDKPVFGMPVVPPGYERFEKRPVDTKIVAVGRSRVRKTDNPWWNDLVVEVRVGAGSADGVVRGMGFVVLDVEDYEAVEITRVGRRTSTGVIVRSVRKRPGESFGPGDDGKELADPPVRVGWRLSTNPVVGARPAEGGP